MKFLPTSSLRRSLLLIAAAGLAACTSVSLQTPPPTGATPPPPPVVLPPPAVVKPAFMRPANGATLSRYDGNKNKGIDIGGALGDPIVATADGRVVIVSDALRGFGTMVIIKHNETFISAYAHIDRAVVKENDVVRQGQKIAEMGKTGTDRVKLHFEIRKQGVAVNPEPYLDGRER
jgi:lipoprotein NlpD